MNTCVLCFPLPDSPVLTSRVAVTVHVLDINEFPPELASPYETFVCENARVGQVRRLSPVGFSCMKTRWCLSEQAAVNWSVVYPPSRAEVPSRCTF